MKGRVWHLNLVNSAAPSTNFNHQSQGYVWTIHAKGDSLSALSHQLFPSLFDNLELQPQYNVAPTQQIPRCAVAAGNDGT